jgi:hypothetical protein
MVKLNVLINLMKEMTSAASEASSNTTLKSVAATQILSGLALTVIVSNNPKNAMVKPNALTSLMKVMRNAASRSTNSIMTKNAAAKNLNGNVVQVTVFQRKASVMELPNAQMDLMKVIRTVASKASTSMTTKSVAATQRMSSNALMETV